MDNQQIQQKLGQAWVYKKEGKIVDAMKLYNEVYEQLIKEAGNFARSFEGSEISEGDVIKVMPQFFNKADGYLKRDKLVCTILNNMGVIFAEVGDKELAKKYFNESIKYAPSSLDYQDSYIGLKNLQAAYFIKRNTKFGIENLNKD